MRGTLKHSQKTTNTKKKKKKKKGENEVQKFGKSRVSVKRILFRLRGCLSG
jgi:hypothetical protein